MRDAWLKILKASEPTTDSVIKVDINECDDILREYFSLLRLSNGFAAFDRALMVFSADEFATRNAMSWVKEEWNTDAPMFFAEDIFGVQFCIFDNKIQSYDPETGELEVLSDSFDDFAAQILNDHSTIVGSGIAREWAEVHGKLDFGKRLAPKLPFVMGGDYSIDNLYPANSTKLIEFRHDLMRQIRDLPDGARIKIRIVE